MFKALFRPAIAAMNRMNYVVKFIFIGLLLLLPFAYVTHIMVKGSDKQIQFNQKESYGVDYIIPASRLLSHFQDCRMYAAAILAGDGSLRDDLRREQKETDTLVPEIDAVDRKHREDFKTEDGRTVCSERWIEIRTRWAIVRAQEFRTAEESFSAYSSLCALVTDWILNYVANYSNLILDPDLDSYWLMDAFVAKLPQVAEDMSQACALGVALSSRGSLAPTSEEKLRIHALYVDATNSLQAFQDVNLKTAYAFNQARSGSLRSRIDPTVQGAMGRSTDFLEGIRAAIVTSDRPASSPRELVASAQKAMDATYALYERVGPELKSLIDVRVEAYQSDKTFGMIAAESATFLHVYLFIAFYLAIHASVAQISKFTKRMIEGTREHFRLDSRDELGTVADSYNRINETLIETRALKTQLESRTVELQDSEKRFRTLASGAPVGIFLTDAEGRCLDVNERWCTLASVAAGEAAGKAWTAVIHPDDRERVGNEWGRAVREGAEFSTEARFGAAQAPVWVSANAVPLRDRSGAVTGFLGSITDISERRKVDQLKNEFISTVSHELRTPLTSIRGSLGLIASGVLGALPPKAKPMVDIATKNCERLVRLVSDILDVEKIASGQVAFKMRSISLAPFIGQVIEANRGFGSSLGVTLRQESPSGEILVRADGDRLSQILTNLVSNACKFSPAGEAVTVSLARREGRIRVSVRDRGPGIPEEFRARIFQKFAQADTSDGSQRKGTGLGLVISKGLIEKMGGTIGFESKIGAGTTFFFDLDEERPVAPVPSQPAGNRPRILICEDERDIAQVLAMLLDREGYASDAAGTLEQAKELLARHSYAGMTLDLSLPDGNGLTLLHELRKNPATARLPVIVISANLEQNRQAISGQAFGLVNWLEKPIPEEALRDALRTCCPATSDRRPRVLHVEDDPDICTVVAGLLRDTAEVVQAGSVMSAWERLKQEDFDLMIIDMGLPDGSGLELLPALRRSTQTPIPSLVFSAHEVSPRTSRYVSAALLKSQTSNDELVSRVRSLLGRAPSAPAVRESLEVKP